MMRVSTSQIYSIVNVGMSNAQTEINKTQEQISSGKRVLSPADDPVASASILQINSELSRIGQYSKNIDLATNSLSLEETSLQSVVSLVQRMQELAVSSGNTAVLTNADYQALAAEVESRTQELFNIQNMRNASGQYIFAGYQGGTQPFVNDGGGNYSYKGDDGQLRLQASVSVSVAVSDSGKRVFMDIPSANKTINTSASSANKAIPPAFISAGEVTNQEVFDKFYPQNMKVTFNAASTLVPAAPNYTITDRATGKVFIENKAFVAGDPIELNGVKFQIFGTPNLGEPAQAGAIPLGNFTPSDFTAGGVGSRTITLKVGGVSETLTLDQNITSLNDLVTALGGDATYPNANPISSSASALANQTKLKNLGVAMTTNGFSMPKGLPISLQLGSAATDGLLGIPTTGSGTGAVLALKNTGASYNFSLPGQAKTVDITLGNKTETLTLNQNVTDMTSLVAAINAGGNAAKLAGLGVSINAQGLITSASTEKISLSMGDLALSNVMGIETLGAGTSSAQGVQAKGGDSFFIDSTNKQGLLTTLSRFSDAMRNVGDTPESKAALSEIISRTLKNLDGAVSNISSVQGDVGARINTLESSKELNLDVELFSRQVLSQIESLDYAEASTRLSLQSLVLSATQQSFVKISQLSLFSYL